MGPKSPKSKHDIENTWRTSIENAQINNDNYKIKVVMFDAAGPDADRIYLDKFQNIVGSGKRYVIKNISKSETMFMINQLGRSGTSANVKINDNLKVFEKAQNYLSEHKEIPTENIALIIKHRIIQLKDEAFLIKRRKLEVIEGMKRESKIMMDKPEVIESAKESMIELRTVSSGKVKSRDKNEPGLSPNEVQGKKYNTMLRIRGEEWRDKIYVEDYPVDGPNFYVAVTNFCDPHLPNWLIKIGVPVTAVVQIKINIPVSQIPTDLSPVLTRRVQSQSELLTMKYINYWKDLEAARTAKDTADDLRNTAFIVFSPPYKSTQHLSADANTIYDEMSYLLYDIQDLTRQHLHYLDNISIHTITTNTVDKRFIEHYKNKSKDVPLECVTVYSVLDNILETVSESETIQSTSGPSSSTYKFEVLKPTKLIPSNKTEKAQTLITEVFNALCKNEKNKMSYRLTYGEEFENQKNPIVIHYGNIAKYLTFHVEKINLKNIIKTTLSGIPIYKIWENHDPPEGELEAKMSYHINVLLSCFERKDVETAELTRLLHILACKKLYNNRSSLLKPSQADKLMTISDMKNVYFRRTTLTEKFEKCSSLMMDIRTISPSLNRLGKITDRERKTDNFIPIEGTEMARITFLFDCPDISDLVSQAEVAGAHQQDHIINDFEYFEDFQNNNALQILYESYNKYNCFDYKYCKVTDCLIVMFYNSHDKSGISRETWRSHIPTAVCLQDFFDFILEDEYYWIKGEEDKYYDIQNKISQSNTTLQCATSKTCIDNSNIETEMLLEGSLKHQELTQLEQINENENQSVSVASTKKTSRSGRSKTSAMEKHSPKNTHRKINEPTVTSVTSLEVKDKIFSAYDLGDRRVEVFGKETGFFSRDGTKVKSIYYGMIPMQYEFIILNVVPGDSANNIWVHKEVGSSTEVRHKVEESFRITTKDQIMYNIKKRYCQIPFTIFTTKELPDIEMPNDPKTEYHSLYVTWANGLVIESIHEENSSKISHIKQTYLTPMPHLNEEARCISTNGEVIAFKYTGDIEIFQPDGSYIIITQYKKNVIYTEKTTAPEQLSASSAASSKSKRGKSRNMRSIKTTSKTTVFSPNFMEDMVPEYRLSINEYEVINTDGLRQKYTNGRFIDIEKLLIRTATDYFLGEVFSRRLDGTCILLNSDGTQIVTFPDGTKIIRQMLIEDEEIYPEWTEDEITCFKIDDIDFYGDNATIKSFPASLKSYGENSHCSASIGSHRGVDYEEVKQELRTDGFISIQIVYIAEHANFATVTINKANDNITIESPNDTSITIDPSNHFKIKVDKATNAKFNGKILHIEYEACEKCRSYTTCDIRMYSDENCSEDDYQKDWLRLKDSFNEKIVVNEEGVIATADEPCSDPGFQTESVHEEEEATGESTENTAMKQNNVKTDVLFHEKCREMHLSNALKFFILRRDGGCSELIHRTNIDDYKRVCRWQPWCSINRYKPFGDHRRLVSILSPVHLNETEKWLMNSKMTRKPKNLTYKDLKVDSGKGFYHWMRPYEFNNQSKERDSMLPPRQPRAFVLRTLEKQWNDRSRHLLKGAKELRTAILKYREVINSECSTLTRDLDVDPRPEKEKRFYEDAQNIGRKIYSELKLRLGEDIRTGLTLSITTKPPMTPEQQSLIKKQEQLQHISLLQKLESLMEPNANLNRYWRRRAKMQMEEDFYKYLLRLPDVPPPYFRNIIGGDIWATLNQLAGDAVDQAQRRKTGCFCDNESDSEKLINILSEDHDDVDDDN